MITLNEDQCSLLQDILSCYRQELYSRRQDALWPEQQKGISQMIDQIDELEGTLAGSEATHG